MIQKIKLTGKEMRYIALFENLTGEMANDCIIDLKRDRIILIVKPGNAGRAIGKHGSRIRVMRQMVKKNIEIVEFADNPIELIKNSFATYIRKTK